MKIIPRGFFTASLAVGFVTAAIAAEPVVTEKPIATLFGKSITLSELNPPANVAGAPQTGPVVQNQAAWQAQQRRERLRGLVWQAVFDDYARQHQIMPTAAEIESNLRHLDRFKQEDKQRRERERQRLIQELKSSQLTETQRKNAQQYLDTLNRLKVFDTQQEQELRDPAREKSRKESERRVTEFWVKRWKVDQALYREFGGRIVFQQAGWEPIDAYRKLLDQYAARKAFVIRDPEFKDAVYSYFQHNFVYADEDKAKFYFEKPYWERTEAELKTAGFK